MSTHGCRVCGDSPSSPSEGTQEPSSPILPVLNGWSIHRCSRRMCMCASANCQTTGLSAVLELGHHRSSGRAVAMTQPSSPIISRSGLATGPGEGIGWLVGRLRFDRLTAGGTEAVLPTVPALEYCVTTQARGGPSIAGACRRFLPSTWRLSTHGCPQR